MSNKEAIQRSGALLLQGWTMLNNNCPICYTALMANKDRSECVCPSCNMPVKTEAEMRKLGQTFTEKPAPAASPLIGNPSSLADPYYMLDGKKFDEADYEYDDEDGAEVPASMEEMRREWEAKTRQQDVVSGLIGEAMLQGWTMLATQCDKARQNHPGFEGVLLVSKGGVTKCVACEKKLGGGAPAKTVVKAAAVPAPATAVSPAKVLPPAPPAAAMNTAWSGADSSAVDAAASVIDRASELIGQYLLRGYTMLDDTCDAQCGLPCFHRVPLVKSFSDNKKICVICESRGHGSAQGHGGKHVAFAGVPADDEDEEAEEAMRKIQGLRSLQQAQAHGLPPSSTAAPTLHPHVAAVVAKHAGLQSAANAVVQQICALTEEMRQTSNLTAVKEYAATIAALVDLVKSMATIP